jgi:hypothetical protein
MEVATTGADSEHTPALHVGKGAAKIVLVQSFVNMLVVGLKLTACTCVFVV